MFKLNFVKSISILLLVILTLSCIISPAFAWDNLKQFDSHHDTSLDGATQDIVGAILNVTRIIGTGIALIMLVVVAMKYMMAAPGERADIKKHAVVYVVGAIVLFGASQLLGIIQKFAQNIKVN